MKSNVLRFAFTLLALSLTAMASRAGQLQTAPAPSSNVTELAAGKNDDAEKRYPLRGVVTAVQAEQSALMIKHEEIPGLMRAMTMLFKVDPATAKTAKPGQQVTGMVVREGDTWWLRDVKLADARAK